MQSGNRFPTTIHQKNKSCYTQFFDYWTGIGYPWHRCIRYILSFRAGFGSRYFSLLTPIILWGPHLSIGSKKKKQIGLKTVRDLDWRTAQKKGNPTMETDDSLRDPDLS